MNHYALKYEFHRLRFLGYNKDFSLGYLYDAKNRRILEFPIAENQSVLDHIRKLSDYVGLPSRNEKYLKVYKIWESLKVKPDLAWRAIRVSISHSTTRIDETKVVDFLISNFGELEISFKRSGQSALFYKFFAQLVEATYSKLLTNLVEAVPLNDNVANKIIRVLDSIRSSRNKETTRPSMLCYYKKPELELSKYIPNRLSNSYIVQK